MIPPLIRRLIATPSQEVVNELFDDQQIVFWVDHRELDETIPEYCEQISRSGKLSATSSDEKLSVSYGDRCAEVPLTLSPADRHITLLTLNEVLTPDFEVRMVWDSNGGDTLAFAVLSRVEWEALEREFGTKRVDAAFLKLAAKPNVFTDHLHRPVAKRWWKFS
jgi:hypothetical protein